MLGVAPPRLAAKEDYKQSVYLASPNDIITIGARLFGGADRDRLAVLRPHEGASWFLDHSLDRKTYTRKIENYLNNFAKQGQLHP